MTKEYVKIIKDSVYATKKMYEHAKKIGYREYGISTSRREEGLDYHTSKSGRWTKFTGRIDRINKSRRNGFSFTFRHYEEFNEKATKYILKRLKKIEMMQRNEKLGERLYYENKKGMSVERAISFI